MNEKRLIRGNKIGLQIAQALGLDHTRVRRIVLDIDPRAIVTAYVEMYGDERLIEISWAASLDDTKVQFSDGTTKQVKP